MNPLKCDEVKNSLVEYLEFELSLNLREQFYEHLAACADCRTLHDNIQDVLMKLKHDDIAQPTQHYWDSLADNVLQEVRQKRYVTSVGGVYAPGGTGGNINHHDEHHHHYDASNVIAFKPSLDHSTSADHSTDVENQSASDTLGDVHKNNHYQSVQISSSAAGHVPDHRASLAKPPATSAIVKWPRVVLPAAAAVLIGLAAIFSLLEKPAPQHFVDGTGFQAKINSEQPLAQLAQQIASLSQSGNRFGFSSQAVLFNSFSIGSLFSKARALATVDDLAPLKTQLALLKTALIREHKPQQSTIKALEDLQIQLNAQNSVKGVDEKLVSLFNSYISIAGQDNQANKQLASAGAWLFDYALAALAQDAAQLKQVQQLQLFKDAMQQIGVPPGVDKSFERLLDIAQQENLTQRDYRQVVREVENIRSLLG